MMGSGGGGSVAAGVGGVPSGVDGVDGAVDDGVGVVAGGLGNISGRNCSSDKSSSSGSGSSVGTPLGKKKRKLLISDHAASSASVDTASHMASVVEDILAPPVLEELSTTFPGSGVGESVSRRC